MTRTGTGHVVLVGGGPGDPGLITRKGLECLRRAEVVVYDHLVAEDLIREAPQEAELIFAGKQAGGPSMNQEQINRLLLEKAGQGAYVVRLKGGDPFVFGRGGEEALALVEAGIGFSVVPGVTAAVAAAAYAGIPVTHRGLATSFEVVTGHPAKDAVAMVDWGRVANGADTLAVYMGVGRMTEITRMLIDGGRPGDIPAAVVQSGTTPHQVTVVGTLGDIARRAKDAGIRPPAVLLVGRVTGLHHRLAWFENQPLFGRRLVVLRPEAQAEELAGPLTTYGAQVIRFPVMKLAGPENEEPLSGAIADLQRFHWLLFSSPNGVRSFFRCLAESGRDARALGGLCIGVVGPGTAEELARQGLRPDMMPSRAVAEMFAADLIGSGDLQGKEILLPQARDARPVLAEKLSAAGARVTAVEAYRMVPAENRADWLREQILQGTVHGLLFTSSSTVTFLLRSLGLSDFGGFPAGCPLISIGPITTETISRLGGAASAEALPHTMAGLIQRTVKLLGRPPAGEDETSDR
jgi:uroporphyrinogen III methyltransferase/synthase